MIRGNAVVVNAKGLHIKPAGAMSRIALKYPCTVYLEVREYQVNAKSVLGILSAQVKCGESIALVCSGEQEQEALAELLAGVESGFGMKE